MNDYKHKSVSTNIFYFYLVKYETFTERISINFIYFSKRLIKIKNIYFFELKLSIKIKNHNMK